MMSEANAATEPVATADVYEICKLARTMTWKKRTNIPGTNWFWINSLTLPAGFEILDRTTKEEIGSVYTNPRPMFRGAADESHVLSLFGPGGAEAVYKLDCRRLHIPAASPVAVVTALMRKMLLEAPKPTQAADWSELATRNGIALALLFCPETGRWLMDKRSRNVSFTGHWGLPGGAINDGEAPSAAAARELSEEAGVHKARYVRTFEVEDRLWCSVFVVENEVKPRKSKESSKIEWVSEFPKPLVPAMEEKLSIYRDVLRDLGAHPPARPTLEAFSPAFKAWFGHSVMVGHDGKPLRMYHGTTYDIPEFKREFVGHGHDQEGSGFYFTSDPDQAAGYNEIKPDLRGILAGPNVMPVYLRIQKPVTNKPLTRSQVERIILAGDEDALWNFGDVGYEGKRRVVQQAVNQYADNDWPTIRILFMLANDFYRGEDGKFLEVLQRVTGYDGIVVHHGDRTIAVVFSPNQIKSVYNPNPSKKSNLVAGAVAEADTGDNKLLWVINGYLGGCLNGEQDPGGEDALADYFTIDRFTEAAKERAENECREFLAAAEQHAELVHDFINRGSLSTRSRYRELGTAFWCSVNRDNGNALSAYDNRKYLPLHELAQSMFKPKRVRIHDDTGTKQSLDLEPKPEADWGRFNSVTAAAEPDAAWHELKLSTHIHGYSINIEPDLDGMGEHQLLATIRRGHLVLSARVITNELRNSSKVGQFFDVVDLCDEKTGDIKDMDNVAWIPVPAFALSSRSAMTHWLVRRMVEAMKRVESEVVAAAEPESNLLARLDNKHLKTEGLDFFFELCPSSEHADEDYVTVDILDKNHEDGLPHLSGRILLSGIGEHVGKFVFRPFELTPKHEDGNPMWLQGSRGTYAARRYEYALQDGTNTYGILRVLTQAYREIVNKFKRGTDMTAAVEPPPVQHISLFERAHSLKQDAEHERITMTVRGVKVMLYVTYWPPRNASDFKVPADMTQQRAERGLYEFDLVLSRERNAMWKSFILCLTTDKQHVRIVDSQGSTEANPGFDVTTGGDKYKSKCLGNGPLRTDAKVPAQDRAILSCLLKQALALYNNVFQENVEAAAEPNDPVSMAALAHILKRKAVNVTTAFGSVVVGYNSYLYVAVKHALNRGEVTCWFTVQPDLNRSDALEVKATSVSVHSDSNSYTGTQLKKKLGDIGYVYIKQDTSIQSVIAALIKKAIWLTDLVFRDHGITITDKRLRTQPYYALQVTQDILRDILDQNPDDPRKLSEDGYKIEIVDRDDTLPLKDRPWFRITAPSARNFLGFFRLVNGAWSPTFWSAPADFHPLGPQAAQVYYVNFKNTKSTTTDLMRCALEYARSQEPTKSTAAAEPHVQAYTLATFLRHLVNEPITSWRDKALHTAIGSVILFDLNMPSLTTLQMQGEFVYENRRYTVRLASVEHKPKNKAYAFTCQPTSYHGPVPTDAVYRFNSTFTHYDGFEIIRRVLDKLLTDPAVQEVTKWKQ